VHAVLKDAAAVVCPLLLNIACSVRGKLRCILLESSGFKQSELPLVLVVGNNPKTQCCMITLLLLMPMLLSVW
jgi:hypothetical protein